MRGPFGKLVARTLDSKPPSRDLLSALKEIEKQSQPSQKDRPNDAKRLREILASATVIKSRPRPPPTSSSQPSTSSSSSFSKESFTWETAPPLGIFDPKIFQNLEEPKSTRRPPAAEVDRQKRIAALNRSQTENPWDKEMHDEEEGPTAWTYPVDSDRFHFDEKDVGFTEHVHLEYLLDDLPKVGPVRRFMELVVVGLQKNPYVPVAEKREHVEWLKKYLVEKHVRGST